MVQGYEKESSGDVVASMAVTGFMPHVGHRQIGSGICICLGRPASTVSSAQTVNHLVDCALHVLNTHVYTSWSACTWMNNTCYTGHSMC